MNEVGQMKQQRGRPTPIHLPPRQMEKELENLLEKWILGESNQNHRRLLRKPHSDNSGNDKSVKTALQSRKLSEVTLKKKHQCQALMMKN